MLLLFHFKFYQSLIDVVLTAEGSTSESELWCLANGLDEGGSASTTSFISITCCLLIALLSLIENSASSEFLVPTVVVVLPDAYDCASSISLSLGLRCGFECSAGSTIDFVGPIKLSTTGRNKKPFIMPNKIIPNHRRKKARKI